MRLNERLGLTLGFGMAPECSADLLVNCIGLGPVLAPKNVSKKGIEFAFLLRKQELKQTCGKRTRRTWHVDLTEAHI